MILYSFIYISNLEIIVYSKFIISIFLSSSFFFLNKISNYITFDIYKLRDTNHSNFKFYLWLGLKLSIFSIINICYVKYFILYILLH